MPSFNTKRIFEFPEVTTATSSHKILIENSAGLAGYINPVNLVSSVIASVSVPLNNIQTIQANTLLGAATAGAPVALDVAAVKSILNYQFDNIGGILNVDHTMVVNSMATITREILTNTNQGAHSSDVHLEIKPSGAQSTQNSPKIGFHSPSYAAASIGLYGHDTNGPIFNVRDTSGTARRIAYVENNLGLYPYVNWIKFYSMAMYDYGVIGPVLVPPIYTNQIHLTFQLGSGGTAVAGNLGDGTFGFISLTGGAVSKNGSTIMPVAFPRCINFSVTNDFGGNHYWNFFSGGYIEVEFRISPNLYRRMRWTGTGNWPLGVNASFSSEMAAAGNSTTLIGSDAGMNNIVVRPPTVDYGYYTTSFSPV